MDEHSEELDALWRVISREQDEIARLRKIEAASRAIVEAYGEATLKALRAALEACDKERTEFLRSITCQSPVETEQRD